MAHILHLTIYQHTSLIHFQANRGNVGATLRATELKPKLDKYLLNKFPGVVDPYVMKKQSTALDYKVRIAPAQPAEVSDIPNRDPLFFGNMGDDHEYKVFIDHDREIKVTFICKDTNKAPLLDIIKKNFYKFLEETNFGTRQSKGFGSFYKTPDKKYCLSGDKLSQRLGKKVYEFESKDWEADIGVLYSMLRSGLNIRNRNGTLFYAKSFLFLYLKHQKKLQWDKKTIKQRFFGRELGNQQHQHRNDDIVSFESDDKYLFRDMLGLSTEQSWRVPYRSTIKKEDAGRDSIERFKSPIFFKPIKIEPGKHKIFFWADDIEDDMYDHEFTIRNRQNTFSLSTPPKSVFNLEEYLDWVFNHKNNLLRMSGADNYSRFRVYRSLNYILNHLVRHT